MAFIAKNPLSAAKLETSPPSPVEGARGLFAKEDGWYDIDDNGEVKKIATGDAGAGGGSIAIDTQMSDTSENAVQNKVIKKYVDGAEGRLAEQISVIDENGEKLENKGAPNGYAPLDEAGKIPNEYLYGNSGGDTEETTYTTYGVSIDLSNSNPETSVTYTDDAFGMNEGSPPWYKMSIFDKIKPCLFKDGRVVGYLNPNNFAQFVDGSAADITSGKAGDVMIEIPKIGYKILKNGTTLTVQITDDPNKKGFSYKAHTRRKDGDRENLYIGAFLGSNKANKLRSISGVAPQNNTTLTDFRIQAKANGAGYDLFAFYPMTLLQCLYLIMYKNLNSQSVLGQGCVGSGGDIKNTGSTTYRGMSYGTSDQMEQMKFLGIEDFWGNLLQWIDGLVSSNDGNALVATDNFNDTGDGYTDAGFVSNGDGGYLKVPQGTNELGFMFGQGGGSATTYFSDFASFYPGYVPCFGGHLYSRSDAGAFRLGVVCSPDDADDRLGGRLMYL